MLLPAEFHQDLMHLSSIKQQVWPCFPCLIYVKLLRLKNPSLSILRGLSFVVRKIRTKTTRKFFLRFLAVCKNGPMVCRRYLKFQNIKLIKLSTNNYGRANQISLFFFGVQNPPPGNLNRFALLIT